MELAEKMNDFWISEGWWVAALAFWKDGRLENMEAASITEMWYRLNLKRIPGSVIYWKRDEFSIVVNTLLEKPISHSECLGSSPSLTVNWLPVNVCTLVGGSRCGSSIWMPAKRVRDSVSVPGPWLRMLLRHLRNEPATGAMTRSSLYSFQINKNAFF